MATDVSAQILYIADQWENHCGYTSAVLSGIRPDTRHLDNGGFHCSIEDLIRFGNQNDYSNTRPDDKGFNPDYGAALDVSMSPADMQRCHARVRRVWADTSDPRRRYINAINTWDGSGDAVRLDFYAGVAKYASPDHKWHNHGEVRRRYLLDWTAAKAIVSVLAGETKTTYLARINPAPETEDDEMTPSEKWVLHVMNYRLEGIKSNKPIIKVPARPDLGPDYKAYEEPNNLAAASTAAELREVTRDAAQNTLIEKVLAADGNPLTAEQLADITEAMRQAAAQAAQAATDRLSAQLRAAALAEADALAAPAGS